MWAPKPPRDELLRNIGRKGHWSRHGLVGAWLFSETRSNRMVDYSGRGHHGSKTFTAAGTGDVFMGPPSFDTSPVAVGQHRGSVLNSNVLNVTDRRFTLGPIPSTHPLSFSSGQTPTFLWGSLIKSGAVSAQFPRVFDKSNSGGGSNGYSIWYRSDANQWEVGLGGTTCTRNLDDTVIQRERWEPWCFRVNDSTDWRESDFFYNGLLQTKTNLSLQTPASTTTDMAIGHWNHSTTNRGWWGQMDYLLIYDRSLSDGEIAFLQNQDPFVGFRDPPSAQTYFIPPTAGPSLFTPRVIMY